MILKKKNKVGGLPFSDFETYYKGRWILWHNSKHVDQWNRTENPENKPIHLLTTDFQQRCQDHSIGKKVVSSTSGAGATGNPYVK